MTELVKQKKVKEEKPAKPKNKYVNTMNNLSNFFSSLGQAPVNLMAVIPTRTVVEKPLSPEEIMLQQFSQKYPQCVSHANKVMYPVDDSLFEEFPFLVSTSKTPRKVYTASSSQRSIVPPLASIT